MMWKKFPQLLLATQEEIELKKLVVESTARVRRSQKLRSEAAERVLHNTLAKTRKIARKTEGKTGEWINQLQERSEEKKEKFSEDYWSQFKKRK